MAIVTRDNERLYFRTWEYNAARIMTALAEKVIDQGGRVKPTHTAVISDRNAEEEVDPITVTHTSYISFVLEEVYYYYQLSDNPFFDFYYQKTPIEEEKRSRDASLEVDERKWLFDCYFKSNCKQREIDKAANLIFEMLCSAPVSQIIRERYKKRVPNIYNDGYHMETVYKPERMVTVEF